MNTKLMASLTMVTMLTAAVAFATEPVAPAAKKASATKAKSQKTTKAPVKNLVDINTATKEELMNLPFIKSEYADKIIAGRPYLSKAHLLTRKIVTGPVYQSIRNEIAVKDAAKALEQVQKKGGKK